jgi:hypothetical protein
MEWMAHQNDPKQQENKVTTFPLTNGLLQRAWESSSNKSKLSKHLCLNEAYLTYKGQRNSFPSSHHPHLTELPLWQRLWGDSERESMLVNNTNGTSGSSDTDITEGTWFFAACQPSGPEVTASTSDAHTSYRDDREKNAEENDVI